MLQRLSIKNLVLVSNCDIHLKPGFNVITGETGAGKSVFLTALSLLMGDRAETSVIRHGEEMAVVEATLSDWDNSFVHVAKEVGIDVTDESYVIIRREIIKNGKSRALINGQLVANSVLKQLTPLLIEECGQHAHLQLKSATAALTLLDIYAGSSLLLSEFQNSLQQERALQTLAETQKKQLSKKAFRIEELTEIIDEIEDARFKEGEEEEIFQRYSRLQNSQEVVDLLQNTQNVLDGTLLPQMKRLKPLVEKAKNLSISLGDHAHAALAELEELSYTIQRERSNLDCNPHEFEKMKARLNLYDKLKRRYGTSLTEIQERLTESKAEVKMLNELDELYLTTQKNLLKVHEETDSLAKKLHTTRQKAASTLTPLLESEIKSLNMPHAAFRIDIAPSVRSHSGDDKVSFLLRPNPGEKEVLVHESASGGELARVFLSLQLILYAKGNSKTLLFDEVDANIGGATATVVGKKLKSLGNNTQVLCITHFSQVALHGDHHYRIEKGVVDGRTLSTIDRLVTAQEIEEELQRMMGQNIAT